MEESLQSLNIRVHVMAEFRQPTTKKDLYAFLESIGYYRKFSPRFSDHSALLTPATSGTAPGKVVWSQEMLDAFQSLRKSLCNHCVLTVPSVSDTFQLHTDASRVGVGAVLNVISRMLNIQWLSSAVSSVDQKEDTQQRKSRPWQW